MTPDSQPAPPSAATGADPWQDPLLVPAKPYAIDLVQLFGNDHPVVLDIGCCRARYLCRQAIHHQAVNFLGLEKKHNRIVKGLKRLHRKGMNNVRLTEGFAEAVLQHRLPEQSLLGVFLICPDPWPKNRHQRRRLVRRQLTRLLERVLVPGGIVMVKTDVPAYAQAVEEAFTQLPVFTPTPTWEAHGHAFDPEILSFYEQRWLEEGRTIHRLGYRKSSL